MNFKQGLRLGLGYFVGLSFFVAIWRFADLAFQSAKLGFFLTLFLCLILATIFLKKNEWSWKLKVSQLMFLVFSAIFIAFFVTSFWSREEFINAFSTVGSGHSPRFANIALNLLENDRIPILGMNYVQSLLSAFPSYLGQRYPLLYLSIWLGVSIYTLMFLTYHLLVWLELDRWTSLVGVFFIFGANTALSLTQYLVIDSGSPYILAGYSDSMHSIGVLIVFAFLLWFLGEKFNSVSFPMKEIFAIAMIGYVNTLMAPQNIIFSIVMLGLMVVICGFKAKRDAKRLKNLIFALVVTSAIVVVGKIMGGFLTPSSLHEKSLIAGVQSISTQQIKIDFAPYLPFHLGNYFGWSFQSWKLPFFSDSLTLLDGIVKFFRSIGETLFVLFFPIFGILMGWILNRKSHRKDFFKIFNLTFLTLGGGLLLVWPIGLCDFKWPQTRFLIPGIFLGQLLFIVSISILLSRLSSIRRILILLLITVFVSWGPYRNALAIINTNISTPVVFKKRLYWLLDYQSLPKVDDTKDIWKCRQN